jgi:hypothetical protein
MRLPARIPYPDDLRYFVEEINVHEAVLCKHAELPAVLKSHAVGGYIGNTAIGKFYPGGGDIGISTDEGCTRCVNFFYRRLNNAQDEVEVMHHQVEHHRNIGTSLIILRNAMHLYECGIGDKWLRGNKRRVKSFHVSNLENNAGFLHKVL